ncbi:MAG TPA: hypothetical protein VIP76_05045 [Luteimonas sp.]
MPTSYLNQIVTGLHRAWQESFVERYRLWEARVLGIEVTQAIQYHRASEHLTDPADRGMDNAVQLVAYKAAWVRVYVRSGLLSSIANVTGTLELARRGYSMSYAIIDTYTPQGGVVTAEQTLAYKTERGQRWRTLNFVIPASEFHGTLRLTARLTGYADSDTSVEVTARLVQTLRVRAMLIAYDGPSTSAPATPTTPVTQLTLARPTLADLQATASTAFAAMPVQATGSFALCANMNWFSPLDDPRTGNGECSVNWNALLWWLSKLRDNDGNRSDVVYYGLLPTGIPLNVPGCGDAGLGAGAAGDLMTFLHEIGHGYGFQHTPCGAAGATDPDYPRYEPYPMASIGEFGLDIRNGTIFDPQTTYDYMSYCNPRWMSLYQLERLVQHERLDPRWLPDRNVFDDHPHQRPYDLEHTWWPDPPWLQENMEHRMNPVISIQGVVHEDGRIEVQSVARIRVMAPAHGTATHWVAKLLDERGAVLSRAILLRREHQGGSCCGCADAHRDPDAPPFAFRTYVPDVAPGASLRIEGPGEESWSRNAEGQPPRFAEAVARLVDEQSLALEWRVEPDEVKDVWLQWRRNGDDAWHGLAVGLQENRATLPLDGLPAGDIELRLIAHDGFFSTESEPIRVALPEREPVVAIVSPPEGMTVRVDTPMQLQGNITDSAGQPLPGESLQWWLDGVPIGRDRERWLTAPAAGRHELVLQVEWERGVVRRRVSFTTERNARYLDQG